MEEITALTRCRASAAVEETRRSVCATVEKKTSLQSNLRPCGPHNNARGVKKKERKRQRFQVLQSVRVCVCV